MEYWYKYINTEILFDRGLTVAFERTKTERASWLFESCGRLNFQINFQRKLDIWK